MGSMGMGAPYYAMMNSAAVAPFTGVASSSQAYHYGLPSADVLPIDDLLDFSNHDLVPTAGASTTAPSGAMANVNEAGQYFMPPAEPCSVGGSCPGSGDQSSFDLYIPCEEAAELEWLSKFVDDSFSDIPNYQSVGLIAPSGTQSQPGRADQSAMATGRGARSKRSRGAPGSTTAAAWTSLLPLPAQSSPTSSSTSSSSSEFPSSKPRADSNGSSKGKKGGGADVGMEAGVRRCTHCASEKTPQWRTGPLGPKTLCNACGVRFKSGRLVPEYRPAASPTFVLTQHSNSHRKVMELRRQKELHIINNAAAAASAAAVASRPDLMFNDHHHHYGVC